MEKQVHLEPVAAYDRIASEFARISKERRAYLDAIEKLVIRSIPSAARSLLDIGAGDGTRSFRIVQAAGIRDFVLLEPSAEMRRQWPSGVRSWPVPAEELSSKNGAFDVITCLWNVLGHIFPAAARVEVLRQCARLLSPGGLIFIDVNHRYNARNYGLWRTLLRMARDLFVPGQTNGDITARWDVNGTVCATLGHVFTDSEFRRMALEAGLKINKLFAVDYRTGEVRRSRLAGSLLYVLSASPTTRQTV